MTVIGVRMSRARVSILAACWGIFGTSISAQPIAHHDIALVPEVTVPLNDPSFPDAVGTIGSVVVGPDGRIAFCDRSNTRVYVLSGDGDVLAAIGRAGSGPAEFLSCDGIALDARGRIIVHDPLNARVQIFEARGNIASSVPVAASGYLGAGAFRVDERGRWWILTGRAERLGVGEIEGLQFVIGTSNGVRTETMILPSRRVNHNGATFSLSTSEGMRDSHAPDTVWAPSSGGALWYAEPATYKVVRVQRSRVTATVIRNLPVVTMSRQELAEWEAFRQYFIRQSRRPHAEIQRQKPAIRALFEDSSERLWVEVYSDASLRRPSVASPGNRPRLTFREQSVFDLHDWRTGQYIGRVRLPWRARIGAVAGNTLWGISEDENGEESLVRYRLQLP